MQTGLFIDLDRARREGYESVFGLFSIHSVVELQVVEGHISIMCGRYVFLSYKNRYYIQM